jgi:GTP cyclohydrolase I
VEKTVNRSKAENAVRDLLSAMNIAIRPGMEETPKRVVSMLEEVWAGEWMTNSEIAAKYGKVFACSDTGMVVVKDIDAFSYCEHHLALMYNMKIAVGYIPHGKVIGLSKIPRIADMVCRRLQLQERIGAEIADILSEIVGEDVCVRIEASHSCLTARGIKKPNAKTLTFERRGVFKNPQEFREFVELIQ